MSFTFAYDVTGAFFNTVPQGFQLCGYDTGSGGVPWTPAMWAAHPGAVHIDQAPDTALLADMLKLPGEPVSTSFTSDVLDVETGAVPVGSPLIASWAKAAMASYNANRRPGQRVPALYQSASNVTLNVNVLASAGIEGIGLWIANWGMSNAQAIAQLAAAAGPYPIIGFQVADVGDYDADIFSTSWLDTVSGAGWVFGPCRSVHFRPGATTTFGVTGYSPGTPEKLGVGDYEIACFEGTAFGKGAQVTGYPVYLPKGKTSAFSYTGHGVKQGVPCTIGVRPVATNGGHAGPWVTGTVTPGS